MKRKDWFRLHSWLGVQLGLLLFVILLTGAFAAISHDVDRWLNPAFRAQDPAPVGAVQWDRMLAEARAQHPEWRPLWLEAGPDEGFAWQLISADSSGGWKRTYLDPHTGNVQGIGHWQNFQRLLRDFHYSLFLPELWGFFLVAAFAIPLLLLTFSPLLFFKRFWRGFYTLRRTRSRRVLWSDLHRLVGSWLLPFLLIIVVTGVWYFAELLSWKPFEHFLEDTPPVLAANRTGGFSGTLTPGQWAAAAEAAYPGLVVKSMHFPQSPDDKVVVVGDAEAWLVRSRANRVHLAPDSSAVLYVQQGEALPVLYRWLHTADVLHFGSFGGGFVRWLWFGFGLLSAALVLTGVLMYGMRLRQKEK